MAKLRETVFLTNEPLEVTETRELTQNYQRARQAVDIELKGAYDPGDVSASLNNTSIVLPTATANSIRSIIIDDDGTTNVTEYTDSGSLNTFLTNVNTVSAGKICALVSSGFFGAFANQITLNLLQNELKLTYPDSYNSPRSAPVPPSGNYIRVQDGQTAVGMTIDPRATARTDPNVFSVRVVGKLTTQSGAGLHNTLTSTFDAYPQIVVTSIQYQPEQIQLEYYPPPGLMSTDSIRVIETYTSNSVYDYIIVSDRTSHRIYFNGTKVKEEPAINTSYTPSITGDVTFTMGRESGCYLHEIYDAALTDTDIADLFQHKSISAPLNYQMNFSLMTLGSTGPYATQVPVSTLDGDPNFRGIIDMTVTESTLTSSATAGDTVINVLDTAPFTAGTTVTIGKDTANEEYNVISGISTRTQGTLNLQFALSNSHVAGVVVITEEPQPAQLPFDYMSTVTRLSDAYNSPKLIGETYGPNDANHMVVREGSHLTTAAGPTYDWGSPGIAKTMTMEFTSLNPVGFQAEKMWEMDLQVAGTVDKAMIMYDTNTGFNTGDVSGNGFVLMPDNTLVFDKPTTINSYPAYQGENAGMLTAGADYTIYADINPTNAGGTGQGRIFAYGETSSDKGNIFRIGDESGGDVGRLASDWVGRTEKSPSNSITFNTWQSVASTFINNVKRRIFVNNVVKKDAATLVNRSSTTTSNVRWGTSFFSGSYNFNGSMRNLRYFNRDIYTDNDNYDRFSLYTKLKVTNFVNGTVPITIMYLNLNEEQGVTGAFIDVRLVPGNSTESFTKDQCEVQLRMKLQSTDGISTYYVGGTIGDLMVNGEVNFIGVSVNCFNGQVTFYSNNGESTGGSSGAKTFYPHGKLTVATSSMTNTTTSEIRVYESSVHNTYLNTADYNRIFGANRTLVLSTGDEVFSLNASVPSIVMASMPQSRVKFIWDDNCVQIRLYRSDDFTYYIAIYSNKVEIREDTWNDNVPTTFQHGVAYEVVVTPYWLDGSYTFSIWINGTIYGLDGPPSFATLALQPYITVQRNASNPTLNIISYVSQFQEAGSPNGWIFDANDYTTGQAPPYTISFVGNTGGTATLTTFDAITISEIPTGSDKLYKIDIQGEPAGSSVFQDTTDTITWTAAGAIPGSSIDFKITMNYVPKLPTEGSSENWCSVTIPNADLTGYVQYTLADVPDWHKMKGPVYIAITLDTDGVSVGWLDLSQQTRTFNRLPMPSNYITPYYYDATYTITGMVVGQSTGGVYLPDLSFYQLGIHDGRYWETLYNSVYTDIPISDPGAQSIPFGPFTLSNVSSVPDEAKQFALLKSDAFDMITGERISDQINGTLTFDANVPATPSSYPVQLVNIKQYPADPIYDDGYPNIYLDSGLNINARFTEYNWPPVTGGSAVNAGVEVDLPTETGPLAGYDGFGVRFTFMVNNATNPTIQISQKVGSSPDYQKFIILLTSSYVLIQSRRDDGESLASATGDYPDGFTPLKELQRVTLVINWDYQQQPLITMNGVSIPINYSGMEYQYPLSITDTWWWNLQCGGANMHMMEIAAGSSPTTSEVGVGNQDLYHLAPGDSNILESALLTGGPVTLGDDFQVHITKNEDYVQLFVDGSLAETAELTISNPFKALQAAASGTEDSGVFKENLVWVRTSNYVPTGTNQNLNVIARDTDSSEMVKIEVSDIQFNSLTRQVATRGIPLFNGGADWDFVSDGPYSLANPLSMPAEYTAAFVLNPKTASWDDADDLIFIDDSLTGYIESETIRLTVYGESGNVYGPENLDGTNGSFSGTITHTGGTINESLDLLTDVANYERLTLSSMPYSSLNGVYSKLPYNAYLEYAGTELDLYYGGDWHVYSKQNSATEWVIVAKRDTDGSASTNPTNGTWLSCVVSSDPALVTGTVPSFIPDYQAVGYEFTTSNSDEYMSGYSPDAGDSQVSYLTSETVTFPSTIVQRFITGIQQLLTPAVSDISDSNTSTITVKVRNTTGNPIKISEIRIRDKNDVNVALNGSSHLQTDDLIISPVDASAVIDGDNSTDVVGSGVLTTIVVQTLQLSNLKSIEIVRDDGDTDITVHPYEVSVIKDYTGITIHSHTFNVVGTGDQITLSGSATLAHDQIYTRVNSGLSVVLDTVSVSPTYDNYGVYSYFNGTDWYYIALDTVFWSVGRSTTDPATWVDSQSLTLSDRENITASSIIYTYPSGYLAPALSAAIVSNHSSIVQTGDNIYAHEFGTAPDYLDLNTDPAWVVPASAYTAHSADPNVLDHTFYFDRDLDITDVQFTWPVDLTSWAGTPTVSSLSLLSGSADVYTIRITQQVPGADHPIPPYPLIEAAGPRSEYLELDMSGYPVQPTLIVLNVDHPDLTMKAFNSTGLIGINATTWTHGRSISVNDAKLGINSPNTNMIYAALYADGTLTPSTDPTWPITPGHFSLFDAESGGGTTYDTAPQYYLLALGGASETNRITYLGSNYSDSTNVICRLVPPEYKIPQAPRPFIYTRDSEFLAFNILMSNGVPFRDVYKFEPVYDVQFSVLKE